MTRILALSGRLQSGKNTSANFIVGMLLKGLDLISRFSINEKGNLVVPVQTENGVVDDEFDFQSPRENVQAWMAEQVWPHIKLYSFADLLKKNVCMEVLGLTYEQCYGTNEQKNELTKYIWEDMPKKVKGKKGQMTAREVMQYWGTEIFRSAYSRVWAESTIRRIENEGSTFAVITDCRFPDEVEEVQKAGGKVVRLTRNGDAPTDHLSELALDRSSFDWSRFDKIIDNTDMTIIDQGIETCNTLKEFGWIEEEQLEPVEGV